MSNIWILGAPDPEMEAIQQLLRQCEQRIAYASVNGVRVHAGNAYDRRVEAVDADGQLVPITDEDHLVLVECDLSGWTPRAVIDHHHPDDPGYGRPPQEFLRASSIGQVACLLEDSLEEHWGPPSGFELHDNFGQLEAYRVGRPDFDLPDIYATYAYQLGEWWLNISSSPRPATADQLWLPVPREIVYTAAADHCLHAAYRGECPGVDPDKLMQWRVATRAEFQQRDPAEILDDIAAAMAKLENSPQVESMSEVVDTRSFGHIQELPEAAARLGVGFVAEVTDRDGRRKVVVQGASERTLWTFLRTNPLGLVDLYGDPRGFAGGYVE